MGAGHWVLAEMDQDERGRLEDANGQHSSLAREAGLFTLEIAGLAGSGGVTRECCPAHTASLGKDPASEFQVQFPLYAVLLSHYCKTENL